MKRYALASLCCFVLAFAARAEENAGDAILGKWFTENNQSKVEITKDGETYVGKIVWLSEPNFPDGDPNAGKPKTDLNNPDEAKQSDPIIGLPLLHSFTYDADAAKWINGKIYDPEKGKVYSCEMTLEGDTLKVRGYIGVPALGRTTTWTRVKAEDEKDEAATTTPAAE